MKYLSEVKKELKEKGKLESTTKFTVALLERAYIKDHPQCSKCPNTKNLTYDHIIPSTILADFNINSKFEFWEENSDVLCYACNQKKRYSLDFTNAKTRVLLLILLNNSKII